MTGITNDTRNGNDDVIDDLMAARSTSSAMFQISDTDPSVVHARSANPMHGAGPRSAGSILIHVSSWLYGRSQWIIQLN